MFISLYTSRIILRELGVTDYGIYNVVAGFVSMFSFISGALSLAISRFITFELGKGKDGNVQKVFSASMVVQILLAVLIIVIGEVFGMWFLNCRMNIPDERMYAANWVFHCSLIAFCINLISIPYNALITAYEKMNVFAYISIIEASLKLAICYVLFITVIDKLILYGILLMLVSLIIRILYGTYCNKKINASKFSFDIECQDIVSIGKFAGWTFFSNGAAILNTQGVNVLTNLYFNVSFNAARGIATQAESAIKQFVNSFTTSINPQIVKNYASGNKIELFRLICRGSKFSYFLFMLLALPFIFETDIVLNLWLTTPPERATTFFRLAIICEMINILGSSGTTACHATGRMRLYVLSITSLSILVFPLTYIAYSLGMPVEFSYYIFIVVYTLINVVRLFVMRKLIGFPIMLFVNEVISRICICTVLSLLFPLLLTCYVDDSIMRLLVVFVVGSIISVAIVYFVGLNYKERQVITDLIRSKWKH